MEYLDDHQEFERLIGRTIEDNGIVAANAPLAQPTKKGAVSGSTVVYFTATWCGPCKRIGPGVAEIVARNPHIRWLKCDVDRNSYTGGFCNVKSIPTFLAIHNTKVLGQIQVSDADRLAEWIEQIFPKIT
jgi:thioredoxin-like negative regulator of GroEL